MSIVSEIRSADVEADIIDAVETVVEAEEVNEDWVNVGSEKNTHFEFQFGGTEDEEVYVYVERLDSESGIEVMVWANESYFDELGDDMPSIEDGGEDLVEFVSILQEYVQSVVSDEKDFNMEFVDFAPPSVVFSSVLYL